METKLCRFCRKVLPYYKFYKRSISKDGCYPICKSCYNKLYSDENYRKAMDTFEDHFGGCTIHILNQPKKGEHKYNIITTKGSIFSYDDREYFLDKLKQML